MSLPKLIKFRRCLTWLGLFCIVFSLVVGCSLTTSVTPTAQSPAPITVTVSAAASLQEALEAIAPLFTQANPRIQVKYNFGASGALQQQIEQGAPADIFLSAATKQMDALQQKDLILADTRQNLLTNQLALIVPKNSALNLTDFRQLTDAKVGKIAVGEPRSVPAGQYAEEVFKNLKLTDALKPKLMYANNVRGILTSVESGNVDAGVVYKTDAQNSNRVKVGAIAAETLHQPIVYPIAVMKSSLHPEAAKTYTQFLFDSQAQTVFQRLGFGQPTS